MPKDLSQEHEHVWSENGVYCVKCGERRVGADVAKIVGAAIWEARDLFRSRQHDNHGMASDIINRTVDELVCRLGLTALGDGQRERIAQLGWNLSTGMCPNWGDTSAWERGKLLAAQTGMETHAQLVRQCYEFADVCGALPPAPGSIASGIGDGERTYTQAEVDSILKAAFPTIASPGSGGGEFNHLYGSAGCPMGSQEWCAAAQSRIAELGEDLKQMHERFNASEETVSSLTEKLKAVEAEVVRLRPFDVASTDLTIRLAITTDALRRVRVETAERVSATMIGVFSIADQALKDINHAE